MLRTNRSPSRSAFFMLRLHGTNRANPSSVGQATLSSALPPLGGDANSAVVGGKIPRDWSLDRSDVIEHQSVVSTQRSCKPKSSKSVLHAADALFHRLFGNKIMWLWDRIATSPVAFCAGLGTRLVLAIAGMFVATGNTCSHIALRHLRHLLSDIQGWGSTNKWNPQPHRPRSNWQLV